MSINIINIKKTQPDQPKQSLFIDPTNNHINLDSLNHQQFIEIKTSSNLVIKRAHHATCLYKNEKMYVYGGYESGGMGILGDFLYFDMINKKWELISKTNQPGTRHSHSLINWNNKIILFGGVISTLQATNTAYEYNLNSPSLGWRQIISKQNKNCPPPLNSHRAILYEDQMIVFGGQTQQTYNDKIYSLNLKQMRWRIIEDVKMNGYVARLDCSVSLYQNKLYVFGGKIDCKRVNDLWQYDLKENCYKKIEFNSAVQPFGRSDHAVGVYKDYLLVFGGSSGVTHERSDLICYDFIQNTWSGHWPDHSERTKQTNTLNNTTNRQTGKKSRSNSFKKLTNSNVSKNCTNFNNDRSELQGSSKLGQGDRKYRRTMKNDNYYNQNYPFYGQKQFLLKNKHKKNDLLVDIQKQSKQQKKKIPLNLSQTFESLNNSLLVSMSHVAAFNNKNDISAINVQNGLSKDDKENMNRYPKPRDGHTCEIVNDKMVIFGGDRHHMSFNDVIVIDLRKLIPIKFENDEDNKQPKNE